MEPRNPPHQTHLQSRQVALVDTLGIKAGPAQGEVERLGRVTVPVGWALLEQDVLTIGL